MSKLPSEVIEKFSALETQVWQNVATSVAHLSEDPIRFDFEGPESVPPEAPRALAGETALSVQFAFAGIPEHNHLVVLNNTSFAALATFLKGEEITEPDESLIPDVREFLEGVVQGICLACGIAKNEPMVASGLNIRYQALTLPDNFTRIEELLKTEIVFSAKELNGAMSWFVDTRTAGYVVGGENSFVESASAQMSGEVAGFGTSSQLPATETGGLDLLLDVPLEISVELGRVRMLVKDVVELGNGSIVEIGKAAGEPVDVMVNGRLVARGEVVVIEDNFGVRITEILTAQERIARLNEAA